MKSVFKMAVVVFLSSISMAIAHEGHDEIGEQCLEFKGGSLHVHVSFEKGPHVDEESVLHVETKDGLTHENIQTQDQLKVTLLMPSMHHGSAPTEIKPVLGENGSPLMGVYRVSHVYFVMEGQWRINVSLTDQQGHVETQYFDVEVSDSSGHSHSMTDPMDHSMHMN